LRQKLLILFTAICLLLVVLAELGAQSLFPAREPSKAEVSRTLIKNQPEDGPTIDIAKIVAGKQNPSPPGLAIRYLALYDGLLFVSLGLMALGGFLSALPKTHIRIQNISLFIASLIDVILCIILALLAFAALIIMVSLFLAAPFGTIAYLIAFGFFDTGRATTILSLLFVLKVVAVVLAVLAGQLNRRILLRFGVSLLLGIVVAFLHGFPPSFLVSILDALTAIVVAIVALLFALPVLVGGIIGVVKSLRA
jgi:hypothetical protein